MSGAGGCELVVSGDAVVVAAADGTRADAPPIDAWGAAERARVPGPARIRLAPPDILWMPIQAGPGGMAAALDDRAPLRAAELGWAIVPDGVLLVRRARLERLAAALGTTRFVAGRTDDESVVIEWRPPAGAAGTRAPPIAALLLATIPLTVWGAATLLSAQVAREIATLRQATARPPADPAPGPGISEVVARIGAVLPETAPLHALAGQASGLVVEVDGADPDRVRDALRGDPVLARLRMVDQRATPDGRIRMLLRGPAR